MERLWSPWRSKYIESFSEKENGKDKVCVFCEKFAQHDDEKNMIVYRGTLCAIIMNIYPYNSGHLLIMPFAHKATFEELTDDENSEVMSQTRLAIRLLRLTSHPDGFNFGANFGRVGGAGIDDHLHFHIVPRWRGDVNFMPVLADTKIVSEDMRDTFRKLTNALATIKP